MTTKGKKNKGKEPKAAASGPKQSKNNEVVPVEKGTSSSEEIGDENPRVAALTNLLEEELKMSLEKSSDLERKNIELMSENEQLTHALGTSEKNIAVQNRHDTLKSLEMQLRDAHDDGAKAQTELELRGRRVLELEALLENKDAEHSDRMIEIGISLDRSESEVARLTNVLGDLQQQSVSLSAESADQIRSLGDRVKILERELSDALEGSMSYRTMIESLEDKVATYSQSETALNARVLELEGLLEQARVAEENFRASKAGCDACEEFEKKVQSLEITNKKLYAKAKLMMKELKESQAAKEAEDDSTQESTAQYLSEIARLKLQLSQIEQLYATSEETKARLEVDLSSVHNKLRLAQEKIAHQVAEAEIVLAQELSAFNGRFDIERANMKNEIDILSKQLEGSSSGTIAASAEILNLKEKFTALGEVLAAKNAESGAVSDEILSSRQRLKQTESRVSELEWSLATAEETVGKERELRERLSEHAESLTGKLRDTIAALKAHRSRVVELEGELEEEKRRGEDREQHLQQQLVSLQQSVSGGRDGEVDERNAAVAAGLARVAELEASAAEAKEVHCSQIENLTAMLASLQGELQAASQASQHESEWSARLAELESVLATTQYEVQLRDDKITEAESHIRDLKVQLDNANGLRLATYEELRLLKGRFESLESEKASVQLMLDKAEADREANHARVNAREEEMATQMKTLDTTNKKLYAKLKLIMKDSNEAKEKCAQAVSENGRLQISVGDLTDQLRRTQNDVTSLTVEKDSLRRRVNELEGLVDSKSAKERQLREEYDEKVNNLSKQVIDLTFSHTELNTQVISLRAERDEAWKAVEAALIQQDPRGNIDAEEKAAMQAAALEDAKKEIVALKKEIDVSTRDKHEFESRMEAMSEKVSRMKTLLVKSKTLAQEREAAVTRAIHAGPKIRRFSIQARVSVASTDADGSLQNWCLLLEEIAMTHQKDAGTGEEDTQKETLTARWVDELSVHQWVEDGAELLGSWPEFMQDMWAKELQTVRSALETERDSLRSQLDDMTKSFNTYKARAQLALKRLGQDDREEKRAFLAEGQLIAELQKQIADLEMRLQDSMQRRVVDMSARDSKLQDTEQLKISLDDERARVVALQRQVHELREQLPRTEAPLVHGGGSPASTTDNPPNAITTYAAVADSRRDEEGHGWGDDAWEEEDDAIDTKSGQEAKPENVYSASEIPGNDSFNKAIGETLFLQRGDDDVRNALATLSAENTKLIDELDDVKLTLKLNNEQMAVLKSSIVDLEASLMRERLLNADNDDRINADYLVSTLRKFFLTDDANERARLVEVVTQILRLRIDEMRTIRIKWAAKKSGWFGGGGENKKYDIDDLDDDGEYRDVAKSAPVADDPYNGYNAFGEGGLDIHT